MIAAQPNAGKSAFAMDLSIKWVQQHGLWGYYFSADTDEGDMKRRALAVLTGESMLDIEEGLDGPGEGWYLDQLDAIQDLRWAFKSDPDVGFIFDELDAFHEAYGAHPDFIVIDNLVNLVGDMENDKHGLMELQKALKYVARTFGVAVIVLHHCKEGSSDPFVPGPRKSVQNMVNELPEQIMTVAYDSENQRFGVAGVKLRGAKADPKAERPVWLGARFETMWFGPIATSTPSAVAEFWESLDE